MGRDSSVGIVTGDELDGQGIELRTRLDRSWGPYPGVQGPRRGVDHSPPPSAEVKGRVKLCLYPPLCLHAGYTANCTFTFTMGSATDVVWKFCRK
jgi:hypothetical protein